jgi:transposase-like protein
MLLQSLIEAIETKDEAIHWARSRGLISVSIDCLNCKQPMAIVGTNEAPDFEVFRCSKCHVKKSIRANSFAFNSKLSLQKLIMLTYHWMSERTNKAVEKELELTNKTVSQWFKYCRSICTFYFECTSICGLIGGPNVIVEIDESVIAKRKYNRGRLIKQRWVFGGLERLHGQRPRRFVELVPNRTRATLLAIIQRRIRPGSIIMTDGWKAYQTLSLHGYQHHVVNHSQNYVDPSDRQIHTQGVENQWRQLKRWLRAKGTNLGDNIQEYINEWLYKQENSSNFDLFLEHIILKQTQ